MLKKITALIIISALLVTGLTACGGSSGITSFACAVSEMPRHFDPQIAQLTSEKTVAVNIFDGLFKLGENGEAVKCAVTDYSVSSDGLVYTFKLREDMNYYISSAAADFIEERGGSVDTSVTAEDFVFGITRAVLPETQAADYELLSVIKNAEKVHGGSVSSDTLGVRAVDSFTLEITLERKYDNFLYALTQPVSYPCCESFFELTAGRYGLEEQYIISNGAFYLSSVSDGQSAAFSKNPEYKGDFPASPSSVRLYLNTDSVDAAKKVDSGTYDCGFFSDSEACSQLGRKVTETELKNIACSLLFNLNSKTMQNNTLRRGLAAAVQLSGVTETPLKTAVPSYFSLSGGSAEGISYNIESARADMISAYEELGIDNLTVNLLCTESDESTAKRIVSYWQKNIGVELNGTVNAVCDEDFVSLLNSGEYDAVIYPLTVDSGSAVDFLEMFASDSEENFFGYSSDEYDRIFEELKLSPDEEKSLDCQSYLMKNAVVLPLFEKTTVFALAEGVSGIYFSSATSNLYFYKGQKQ